jgi:hypothetical protein
MDTRHASAYLDELQAGEPEVFMEEHRSPTNGGGIEPPSVPDGTFVKVRPDEHPLGRACEVAVYFQDYHRSSSKLGRFGKIVGIDTEGGEYLVMLDNFECLAVPMRRVEWRKVAT